MNAAEDRSGNETIIVNGFNVKVLELIVDYR